MTRTAQSRDVFKNDVIGNWKVVSSAPVRTNGKLTWTIACPNNHEVQAEHASLSYGVVPTQCAQCVQQAATARANERIEERRLIAKVAAEIRAAQSARRDSAAIAGSAAPAETLTRAIYLPAEQAVPQQHEVQEGNTNA